MNTRRMSIRSMGFYLIRKSWFILVVAILCGALFAGLKYRDDKEAAKQPVIKDDGSSLTTAERQDVDHAVMQYQCVKQIEEYLKGSPLVRINAKKEKQNYVEYSIFYDAPNGEQSTGVKESSYLQIIKAYILDGVYVNDLLGISQEYASHTYIKELVTCNSTAGGEFTLLVLESNMYPNLVKDVRTVVEAYMDQMMKQEKGLRISMIKDGQFNFYDSSTETVQKNTFSSLMTYRKAFIGAYANFTEAQQAYFRRRTGYLEQSSREYGEYLPVPGFTEEELIGETKVLFSAPTNVKIGKKQFMLGFGIGILGGVALCFLMLYLSLKNRSTLDYSDNLGLRNMGLVSVNGKKHSIRNCVTKMEMKKQLFASNEESVDYAAVRIGAYCENHGIKELAVLSSNGTEDIQNAVEMLKDSLAKQGIMLHQTEKVAADSEALKALLSSKNSILVEQLHDGNRKKASELLKFCKENDVEVIGALGVAALKK